jgi:hypothetical protein
MAISQLAYSPVQCSNRLSATEDALYVLGGRWTIRVRKYAMGDMAYNSFVFTGPQSKLQLKSHNLMMVVQLAEGIDDDTWLYHLERNDYKNWVDGCIHDQSPAELIEQTAKQDPDVSISKRIILGYIKEKYTSV